MTEITPELLIENRSHIANLFRAAFLKEPSITGALLIGSVGNGASDEFSDLDYYIFSELEEFTHANILPWLDANNVDVSLYHHDINEPKKHTLISETTRVDIHLLDIAAIDELGLWPRLFFSTESIVKDSNNRLRDIISGHKGFRGEVDDDQNNLNAYIINLIDTLHEFITDDNLVKLAHAHTGLIESKARILARPAFATALWREPSRHFEENSDEDRVAELHTVAFPSSRESMRQMLIKETSAIIDDPTLTMDVRSILESALIHLRS